MNSSKKLSDAEKELITLKSRKANGKVQPGTPHDSMDRDSHSSFGSNFNEGENPLLKQIMARVRQLETWYLSSVTYKQESKLLALSIGLVYTIVGVTIICINYIQLPNKSSAIVIQALYALIGLLAVKWTSVVNSRIAELSCMVSVVYGEAKTKNIIAVSKHQNKSRVLSLFCILPLTIAYIFYACLIGTQLSIALRPLISPLGNGSAGVVPFELAPRTNIKPYELFLVAVGTQFSCPKCASFTKDDYYFVPASVQLRDGRVKNRQVLETHIQDIIALKTVCKTMDTPEGFETDEYDMIFDVLSATKAMSGTILEFEIRSRAGFHFETFIRRCIISTEDVRGNVMVRYTATPDGRVIRKAVEQVTTNNEPNCQMIAGICLGPPERKDFSHTLLSEVFQVGSFNMDQDYSLSAGLFPDPSLNMDDETYGRRISSIISNILLVVASQRTDHFEEVALYTDDIAIRFESPSWLLVIAFVSAMVCASTGALLIVLNLVKLEKTEDKYLHYLSNCIRPGKKQMESYQKFLEYAQENQLGNWEEEVLRYGEDKETKNEAVGRLMFGQKDSIMKYKNMRAYTQGLS